jgi:hypothetical protein
MTPIKMIGWYKTFVVAIDFAGNVQPICMAASETQAEWVGWSLGRAHSVEARKFDGMPAARIAIEETDRA